VDTLNQNDIPVMKANNAISLFSWLTKALVMRHHRQADIWVDKLIGMLSHGILGTCVAEGFKLIMDQNDEYINSDNYCNIRSVLCISFCLNRFTFLEVIYVYPCVSFTKLYRFDEIWCLEVKS
jgi:hypothetical protein